MYYQTVFAGDADGSTKHQSGDSNISAASQRYSGLMRRALRRELLNWQLKVGKEAEVRFSQEENQSDKRSLKRHSNT